MSGPDVYVEPTLTELVQQRNRLNSAIDRLTAETENTPGAITIVRDFLNWYGWYEREGFDNESKEELERIVEGAKRLVSSSGDSSNG